MGRVDELPDEDVAPLRAFGQELVLWRDHDGHHVADAWCPHLGAHLGYGGRISDGCLVCPFHEWSFDATGTNVAIPYAERPNRKARLRLYPTMVRNRHLLAWYHPDATVEPMWDIPERLPEDPVECLRFDRRIKTVWQELAENAVDMAHFVSVHGAGRVADVGELVIDGHYRRVRSTQAFQTGRGEIDGEIESNSHGPGIGIITFRLMSEVTLVSAVTPIDAEEIQVRFTMYHAAGDEIASKIGQAFGAEVARQLDQDIPIWEHKRYQPSPALAPNEKPVTEFRRWATQFYV
jgi:phenylpropionate dioxygenase-like ring-hydroxylating dioxygenase large terminal subunit